MKQASIILIVSFLLVSCKEKQPDKYENLYEIIDELLRFNYYDAGVVVLELTEISTPTSYYIDINGDTINYNEPQPKSPGVITYNKSWFEFLYKIGMIDSAEIDYFFNQIDTLKPYTLDPARINKNTISSSELNQIFNQYGIDSTYSILSEKYSYPCIIQFSTPLISHDGSKIIIDIDSHCGKLSGGGMRYIFERKNGKWRIIYSKGTWIS